MKQSGGNLDEKPSRQWWMNMVTCAWCGANPIGDGFAKEMECQSCSRPFAVKNNRLVWPAKEEKASRDVFAGGILKFLRRALNPLSSPMSPLRYWSNFRTGRYYRRTVADPLLAQRWAEHYLSGLELPADAILLDHGCGKGRHTGLLNQLGFRTVGQDIAENAWWDRLTGSGFQVVPPGCVRLPWASRSFDLVLDVGVIGFVPRDGLEAFMSEVRRVLKPGAYWVVLEANDQSYGWRHFQQAVVPLSFVRSLAEKIRFAEVDVSYEGFYAPAFPILINFLRKQCAPCAMNGYDFDSWLARQIPAEKRGTWLLRLRRAGE